MSIYAYIVKGYFDKIVAKKIKCSMTTISLCMIVRDEESTLDRILNIAKEFADEIIIVDTGSCDQTVKIAKKYTDKVYFFKWVNDFSKARNFSLQKATMDYIMWLDADDYIDDDNLQKIKNMKKTDLYADIYMFKYKVFSNNDYSGNLEFFRERLLKRSRKFFFEGAVHEAVSLNGSIVYQDVTIEHRKKKAPVPERNLKIYRLLEKNGEKFAPRDIYYYARELYYNGYFDEAKKRFEEFLNSGGSDYDKDEGYILLCDCLLKQKNTDLAEDVIFTALKKFPPYPEIFCKAGEVFFTKGEYKKAAAYYRAAETAEQKDYGFIREDYKDFIPCLMLTVIYFKLERYDLAKNYHQKCKRLRPNHPSVIFNDKLPILGGSGDAESKIENESENE